MAITENCIICGRAGGEVLLFPDGLYHDKDGVIWREREDGASVCGPCWEKPPALPDPVQADAPDRKGKPTKEELSAIRSAAGKKGKGKPKHYSEQERARRRDRLRVLREAYQAAMRAEKERKAMQ